MAERVELYFWSRNQGSPGGEPQPWVQPQGSHDAYHLGALVTHSGSTWESTVDSNVWEPGVVHSVWVIV